MPLLYNVKNSRQLLLLLVNKIANVPLHESLKIRPETRGNTGGVGRKTGVFGRELLNPGDQKSEVVRAEN